MTIEKLEDFRLWQEAMKLRKMVYNTAKNLPKEEKYITVHHLKECARNAPGNIAEAFGRFHYQESIQFYRIARGSVNEIKSDTYSALEEELITKETTDLIITQCDLVIKMINATISSALSRKSRNNQ